MAIGVRLRDFFGFVEFWQLSGSCCRILPFSLNTRFLIYFFFYFFLTAIQNIKFLQ
jgi:hypothetical protein